MIEAERIADVLGGEKVLKREIRSLAELAAIVRHGLPGVYLGMTDGNESVIRKR